LKTKPPPSNKPAGFWRTSIQVNFCQFARRAGPLLADAIVGMDANRLASRPSRWLADIPAGLEKNARRLHLPVLALGAAATKAEIYWIRLAAGHRPKKHQIWTCDSDFAIGAAWTTI
jgi:hypothetical protein